MIDNKLKELISIAIIFKLAIFLVIILAYFVLPFNTGNYPLILFILPMNRQLFSAYSKPGMASIIYSSQKKGIQTE
jgi:hypothetical protein